MKTMGSIIRRLRCEKNLTQGQMAEALNVTTQAISKWENDIGMPDISQIVPIAHFFGVSTDVLFGTEEESVSDDVQTWIEEATAKESFDEEYRMLQDALKLYPGDVRLLSELLSSGQCRMADGDTLSGDERERVFRECEQAGKLITAYSKDVALLVNTAEWMVRLYCEMSEPEKALEISETLPSMLGLNKEAALARICEMDGQYQKAAKYYEDNVSQHMSALMHAIVLCGNMYVQAREQSKAKDYYAWALCIGEEFLDSRVVLNKESLRKNILKITERCRKNLERIK